MKKTFTIIIIIGLLAGGFIAWRYTNAQAQQQSMNEYETQPIERGSLTSIVGATGAVRSIPTIRITRRTWSR